MSRVLLIASLAESLVNFRGRFIEELIARGHDVSVAAPDAPTVVSRTNWQTMPASYDLSLRRTSLGPLGDLKTLRAIDKLVRDIQPDVLIAYTIKPVIYSGFIARWRKVPRYFPLITGLGYVFRSTGWRARAVRLLVGRMYRASMRTATTVFFQNTDDRDLFAAAAVIGSRQCTVITAGSGVDLEQFRAMPLLRNARVLMVGRLLNDKGVREFAAAARSVRKLRPDAEFHLVGWLDEGNPNSVDVESLRTWIADGDIIWSGAVADVRPALAACQIYVLPSYHEGTPRSVLEALAVGRPIVTTNVPGCRETVRDGVNGLLVPKGDAVALADAICKLLMDDKMCDQMAEESLRMAQDKFDVRAVNGQLIYEMRL